MPGKKSQLTPLETRKQLLLVESELNRVHLLNEVHDFKNEIQHLQQQMQAISSMVSAAAKLAATFSTVCRAFSHRDEGGNKTSWISTLLDGVQTGTSLWLLLRSCWRKS